MTILACLGPLAHPDERHKKSQIMQFVDVIIQITRASFCISQVAEDQRIVLHRQSRHVLGDPH